MGTMTTFEKEWNKMYARYDAAMVVGDLDTAFLIAYENIDDFAWEGEYPEDWTKEQIKQHINCSEKS